MINIYTIPLAFIVAYIIYSLSVIIHELGHVKKAEKYKFKMLRTKQELVNANREKKCKLSFFILGFEFCLFGGGYTHF